MRTPNTYTKPATTIEEQIALLKTRGLIIADEIAAFKFLSHVSYFRFIQYLRPMEIDKTTHQFKDNSKFNDAVCLYNFDSELRTLLFDAIQHIEIALRSKIIHEFSLAHHPFWFFDTSLSTDGHKFIENVSTLDRELNRSKEDFIKEHYNTYGSSTFPPAWKTLELASLGTLSKLYCNFSDTRTKKRIARSFNIPQHEVMESWLRSVTILRNYCAHHSRLWNRNFPNAPQIIVRMRGNWINTSGINTNKLYAIASCIAYWLESLEYGASFKSRLKQLISTYSQVDPTAMGFPPDWTSHHLWQ